MIAQIAVLLFALSASGADAHDYWSDGKTIPDWVKSSCCGPADAHHLRPEQVHRISDDYYSVDGYIRRIPSVRRCPARMETTGSFTGMMGPAGNPASTASSCRWPSDFRRRVCFELSVGPLAPGRRRAVTIAEDAFLSASR